MAMIPFIGLIGSFVAFLPIIGMFTHWILFFLMVFFIFVVLNAPTYIPNKDSKVIYTQYKKMIKIINNFNIKKTHLIQKLNVSFMSNRVQTRSIK